MYEGELRDKVTWGRTGYHSIITSFLSRFLCWNRTLGSDVCFTRGVLLTLYNIPFLLPFQQQNQVASFDNFFNLTKQTPWLSCQFTQWLASCAEVWNFAGLFEVVWSSLSSILFVKFFTHILLSLFICATSSPQFAHNMTTRPLRAHWKRESFSPATTQSSLPTPPTCRVWPLVTSFCSPNTAWSLESSHRPQLQVQISTWQWLQKHV